MTIIEGLWRETPEWGRWGRQIQATHLDLSCGVCAYPGPLLDCFGSTEMPEQIGRRVVVPSRIAEGQRLRSVPYVLPARSIRTHYAVRCPACGDQVVYRVGTWEELDEAAVAGPAAPRSSGCCEHECGAGPHSHRQ